MPSCRDIETLITAVIDDEATAAEREAVGDHLRECAPCRQRASTERGVRRILRERVGAFHVTAPAALRAKCQPPPRPTAWWRAPARPTRVWATAAAVVVIFAAAFYVMSRGSVAFASELALDHLKCFALFEKTAGPGDAEAIAGRMRASYGWDISVPHGSRVLGLQLVGGRRCFSTDGRVAHILYRHAGRPLSLFIVPRTSRAAERLAVIGHEAIIWSHRDTTYVVLAREPADQVARVATYIRSVVE